MVDEYQDTNRLQDLLYHCLANEEGSNLFFVGDMKQGIYSFRQADPEIFWEKRRSFAPMDPAVKDEAQTYPAQLALDRNFRSAAGVIGSINGLCDAVMSRRLGGVDYADSAGERLCLPENAGSYPGGCEMHLVSGGGQDANAAAARIRRLLEEGFPVRGHPSLPSGGFLHPPAYPQELWRLRAGAGSPGAGSLRRCERKPAGSPGSPPAGKPAAGAG